MNYIQGYNTALAQLGLTKLAFPAAAASVLTRPILQLGRRAATTAGRGAIPMAVPRAATTAGRGAIPMAVPRAATTAGRGAIPMAVPRAATTAGRGAIPMAVPRGMPLGQSGAMRTPQTMPSPSASSLWARMRSGMSGLKNKLTGVGTAVRGQALGAGSTIKNLMPSGKTVALGTGAVGAGMYLGSQNSPTVPNYGGWEYQNY
jgi:hypothetical protein